MTKIERYTEELVLNEMKVCLGENAFGYVFPQGNIPEIEKVDRLLKKAGGKPKECDIHDYTQVSIGKAKPEFIITFKNDSKTLIIIECKNSIHKHESPSFNKPRDYAVDGLLYYAKYLKDDYNLICLAVSGTKKETMRVSTFYWMRGQESFNELRKAKDILLEPNNYIEIIKGNKLQKAYSLEDIRETAILMHDYLREIKMTERHKPIFIAGILIALSDIDFANSYVLLPSFSTVIQHIQISIENVLKDSGIKVSRINYIKQAFKNLLDNTKFSSIPLGYKKSITWYIEELEMKIKPMMDYSDSTIDALGVFYHEFIKYSGGDGSGLGIVLTPQHLTEFMCDLAGVNKNSSVLDICCGSGSFLVTSMSKMFNQANAQEIDNIRQNKLFGVEFDDELYTLSISNMIIRKDGKSNIYYGDCFDERITRELKQRNINIGLINPPYSQKDVNELEFVEHLLDILAPGGTGVVVVPMSCAIGNKFKDVRERLLRKNTLKAVFSMPDDIFYPTGTNVCVMVWEAHTPHNSDNSTYFGYCKDDGFVKRKKLGRIDANNAWANIEKKWLKMYYNREIKDGLSSLHQIAADDEWLCEAYMQTDYSIISKELFNQTLNNHLSYLVKFSATDLSQKSNVLPELDLNQFKWAKFSLSELFTPVRGVRQTEPERINGDIPLVTAGENYNGVKQFISNGYSKLLSNKITIDMFCNSFYQEGEFYFDDNIISLHNEKLNKYNALFISTIIGIDKYRYAYGRQYRLKNFMQHEIILPSIKINKKIEPDWALMENYIKSLEYSKYI